MWSMNTLAGMVVATRRAMALAGMGCALLAWSCDPGLPALEGADSSAAGEQAPMGPTGPSGPASWDEGAASEALASGEAAIAYVNARRTELGLAPLEASVELSGAARSHAEFLVAHASYYASHDLSVHEEPLGLAGFTGSGCRARAEQHGFVGGCVGEVIAGKASGVAAARSWMESLYHRLPLLSASATSIGYGEADGADGRVNVMEVFREE